MSEQRYEGESSVHNCVKKISDNHLVSYNVYRALELGIIRTFLAKIKRVVILCETCDLCVKANIIKPIFYESTRTLFMTIWIILRKTACELIQYSF